VGTTLRRSTGAGLYSAVFFYSLLASAAVWLWLARNALTVDTSKIRKLPRNEVTQIMSSFIFYF